MSDEHDLDAIDEYLAEKGMGWRLSEPDEIDYRVWMRRHTRKDGTERWVWAGYWVQKPAKQECDCGLQHVKLGQFLGTERWSPTRNITHAILLAKKMRRRAFSVGLWLSGDPPSTIHGYSYYCQVFWSDEKYEQHQTEAGDNNNLCLAIARACYAALGGEHA